MLAAIPTYEKGVESRQICETLGKKVPPGRCGNRRVAACAKERRGRKAGNAPAGLPLSVLAWIEAADPV
jgi:hypothetical protein